MILPLFRPAGRHRCASEKRPQGSAERLEALMLDAEPAPLVQVEDLKMHFPIYTGLFRKHTGDVKAVDGVSFQIEQGQTLGLVGESGCGKSTVGRAMLRLYEPTAGRVLIGGEDVARLAPEALRKKRPSMQMVFQDPQACLNPRMTLEEIVSEPLDEHTDWSRDKKLERVYELMDQVGLNRRFVNRFPHEFSGGQRQRIGIARALALKPQFIVCDEPIAALDVSIQAQVVNLLEDLQAKLGLTYLFISHDLSMVRHLAQKVAVMYLGRIAELSPSKDLYARPLHPYAEALLSAVNEPDPELAARRNRIILKGDVPSPANPPKGCNFCTRCPKVMDICRQVKPDLTEVEPGRLVACHLYETKSAAGATGGPEAPNNKKSERNQQGVNQ